MKTLYSENLKIRPLQVGDKNSVHEFLGDFENSKYLLGATSSIEETESFINKAIKRSKDIPISEYHYAVVLRENNKLIGSCSLEVDIPFNEAELGWMLNKRFWSNGYGTQIARALMKFGFEDLDLLYVTAEIQLHTSLWRSAV